MFIRRQREKTYSYDNCCFVCLVSVSRCVLCSLYVEFCCCALFLLFSFCFIINWNAFETQTNATTTETSKQFQWFFIRSVCVVRPIAIGMNLVYGKLWLDNSLGLCAQSGTKWWTFSRFVSSDFDFNLPIEWVAAAAAAVVVTVWPSPAANLTAKNSAMFVLVALPKKANCTKKKKFTSTHTHAHMRNQIRIYKICKTFSVVRISQLKLVILCTTPWRCCGVCVRVCLCINMKFSDFTARLRSINARATFAEFFLCHSSLSLLSMCGAICTRIRGSVRARFRARTTSGVLTIIYVKLYTQSPDLIHSIARWLKKNSIIHRHTIPFASHKTLRFLPHPSVAACACERMCVCWKAAIQIQRNPSIGFQLDQINFQWRWNYEKNVFSIHLIFFFWIN